MKTYKLLSGSVLKLTAVCCMLVDHVTRLGAHVWPWMGDALLTVGHTAVTPAFIGTAVIGRMAFPLFAFLCVEGFRHTSDLKKYMLTMLVFAVLSIVPFNLMKGNVWYYWRNLNVLFTLLLLPACSDDKPEESDDSHVLVMFMAGYNNLSGNIATNLELELTKGSLPAKGSSNAIVIFSHCSPYAMEGHRYKSTQQYDVPTQPVLIRAYSEGGKAVLDTHKRYPTDFDYTDSENLGAVLSQIVGQFPAKRYGLLYSSHGTGWLPADDTVKTRSVGALARL